MLPLITKYNESIAGVLANLLLYNSNYPDFKNLQIKCIQQSLFRS